MKTGTIFFIVIFIMILLTAFYFWNKNRLNKTYNTIIGDSLAYNKCVEDNKKLPVGSACKSCAPNGVGSFNGTIDSTGRCVIK